MQQYKRSDIHNHSRYSNLRLRDALPKPKDLIDRAWGLDDSEVDSSLYVNKGISNEVTLPFDATDSSMLFDSLFSLSDKVSNRIKNMDKYAFVVCVVLNIIGLVNIIKKIRNS